MLIDTVALLTATHSRLGARHFSSSYPVRFLTATLTATPTNCGEPRRTADPGAQLQDELWRTVPNAGGRCARELQNRWSASLAMLTDGLPSPPAISYWASRA